MTGLRTERIALATGVSLNVRLGGSGEPIIFLHGFPESHRTWRHQLADLSRDHFVVAPDQRGFGDSDRPQLLSDYETNKLVADIMALADSLGIERFTLAGHDWGGAVAWLAALTESARIRRLVIVNAPHPLIFQKSVIEDPAQRAASQYIRAFRSQLMEVGIEEMGLETFFAKSFGRHAAMGTVPEEERRAYVEDWAKPGALTSMLNWYRASNLEVPAPEEKADLPVWTRVAFPTLRMPVLVIWGMKDKALLPIQLEGLDKVVADLRIERIEDAAHFVTWEKPEAVTAAIRAFVGTAGSGASPRAELDA